MKIVVDCRYTRIGRHDGISRYTARVVEALARRHPVTMLISDKRQLDLLPDLPWELATDPTSPRELTIARRINRLRPDVLWSPMQTIGSWGRRYGLVLTLHDLIYYRHRTPPRDLPGPVRLLWRLYHLAWWPQRLLLNRADEVVTISATTKALIERHRLTRRRVTIVTNAADPLGTPAARRSAPTSRELVYMGSFMPYKNVDTIARALAQLPGYRLHLMSRIDPAERARLEAIAPAGSLEFHDGASDQQYAAVLGRAHALVHASYDEGFGIPLVEAMGLGTPLVVADTPIFREVGEEAALYFPGDDPAALADRVRALEDPNQWLGRSALSVARAATYSWDDAADALLAVLERVVAARSST